MHRWPTVRARGMAFAFMAVVAATGCTSAAPPVRPASPAVTITATATADTDIGAGRPGLASAGGRLYMGWAASTATSGTQPLGLGWTADGGSTVIRIVDAERVPAGEGPAIAADGAGVDMAWADGNTTGLLTAARLDGPTINCRTTFAAVTTLHSPALVTTAAGIQYLAWTDTTGHVNVGELDSSTCADTQAMTLNHRITLTGTVSAAGPAMIGDGAGDGLAVLVAWTDLSGMVNVGTYGGTGTLTDPVRVMTPVGVAGAPGLGATASDLYLGFVGTDGIIYHAYSEGCAPACFHVTATATHAVSGYGMASDAGMVWAAYFDTGHHLRFERF